MMYAELGDYAKAHDDGSRATGLQDSVQQPLFRCTFAAMMAKGGDFELAHRIAEILRKEMLAGTYYGKAAYYFAEGGINLARGEADQAVTSLEQSLKGGDYYDTRYLLGRAYLEAGRYRDAIDMLQSVDRDMQDPMRLVFAIWAVKTHYYLGRAYEKSGELDKAIAQYETFLDIWRNADPGIEAINDARARLSRLQG
jgi:tetratricopeptide (TPR) repeat protein